MSSHLNFWQGKKVLLTGHTGFKGTWMSVMLEALGAEVCGYSLPLSPYFFYCKAEAKVAEHHEGDIADRDKLERVVSGFRPEIVIHLASHSSLDGSDRMPDYILHTNIMGVVNLLDICRNLECVRSVVIVTSDKCYRNMESEKPYGEQCELGGEDPYSVSKVCQELITNCYQKTFFEQCNVHTGIATARASNVIGMGDYNITRLMPYLLDCYISGRLPRIRNPYAVRPWQYVLDVLYGYLLLAEKLYCSSGHDVRFNGPYNFGPDEDGFVRVGEVCDMVGRCFGREGYEIQDEARHIYRETDILKLDSSKAKKVLGWRIQKNLKDVIALTADCVKQEQRGIATSAICREQVRAYLEGVR